MAVDYSVQGAVSVRPADTTQAIDNDSFVVQDTESEFISQVYSIANLAVDQVIALGPLAAAAMLYIVSDQEVTFKLNGDLVGFPAKVFILQSTAITAITVSNASGALATIRVVATGS
jgi:formate-dependent phosphoribosylglycinamide formyltransferase (GAR transformylase)